MLTEEASRQRWWGPFPALRKAIEKKRVPDSYYGPTSVSDNVFESLGRLVSIAILAHEYRSIVKQAARSVGVEAMSRDLRKLEDDIEAARSFLNQQAENVRALYSDL